MNEEKIIKGRIISMSWKTVNTKNGVRDNWSYKIEENKTNSIWMSSFKQYKEVLGKIVMVKYSINENTKNLSKPFYNIIDIVESTNSINNNSLLDENNNLLCSDMTLLPEEETVMNKIRCIKDQNKVNEFTFGQTVYGELAKIGLQTSDERLKQLWSFYCKKTM